MVECLQLQEEKKDKTASGLEEAEDEEEHRGDEAADAGGEANNSSHAEDHEAEPKRGAKSAQKGEEGVIGSEKTMAIHNEEGGGGVLQEGLGQGEEGGQALLEGEEKGGEGHDAKN